MDLREEYFVKAIAAGFLTWDPYAGHEYMPKQKLQTDESLKKSVKKILKVKRTIIKSPKMVRELVGKKRMGRENGIFNRGNASLLPSAKENLKNKLSVLANQTGTPTVDTIEDLLNCF